MIGKYSILDKCRICSSQLEKVYSFERNVPLAGAFLSNLTTDVQHEKYYPLTLLYCTQCSTGFCKEIVDSSNLFKDVGNNNAYFYYSSQIKSLVDHFTQFAHDLALKFTPNKTKVLEIGCNDGVLLTPLRKLGFKTIGVDPSQTIKHINDPDIVTYNSYFDDSITNDIINKYGKQDIVFSANCLAHIDNIDLLYKNIKKILKPNGYAIIEVHYFKNIIDSMNFDFIYHEHMTYYTTTSFKYIASKYNLKLTDIEMIKTHGGSLRVYLKNTDDQIDAFEQIETVDTERNIHKELNKMVKNINSWNTKFNKYMTKFIATNKDLKLVGYGASGRTNTILSTCDIKFDLIIDDSKSKIGKFVPKYHTPIVDSTVLYANSDIDTVFILAWPYAKFIIKKHLDFLKRGGTFVVILPKINEITIKNYESIV